MSTLTSDLERLNNPQRFAQIEQMHRRAFSWQRQGYIPLGVHVANPQHIRGVDYSQRLDAEVFFWIHSRYLLDTLQVGSDLLPVVGMNHLGNVLVPSMFGAEQFVPDVMCASLQDVGPTPLAVLVGIEEVEDLQSPGMDSGILPQVQAMGRYYRRHLPDWVAIVGTMCEGPFSMAMEMRGSSLLVDLVDHPQLSQRLITLCARTQANVERNFRQMMGTLTNPFFTNFGIAGTGLRLGDDSICNLSPEMIGRFCGPAYQIIIEIWGGCGHVHCCSLEHSRFEHLFETLARIPEVAVFSTQFGFEYYQEHLEELRGRLAIESFYGDAYSYVCRQHGSFRNWANEFVPRFKNESGLVLYTQVESVEEGKEIHAYWKEAHEL
ncbi:MAG: hypothetical protein QGG53_21880 [Planctomycetota bacterium]|nr:hypothetical protein [Planctomycetota bacterium]